ncbi:MAG: PIN domain-containing protein [Deltaproteobacteria bacterium]|nr:PIN domain-containing protein [Deltaproteobacteria bacterium]
MKLFVDTSAFIALVDATDKHHRAAKKCYIEIIESGNRLVSSNFVICETLNYLRTRISYRVSIEFRESVYKSNILEITPVSSEIEEAAYKIFKKYKDKDFSFTDCTSFALMEREKIKKVFSFDHHFVQYGSFQVIP